MQGGMAELSDFDRNGARESLWSEEHDRVPLKQRLKMLLASKKFEDFDASKTPIIDVYAKKEDEHFESQVTHSSCSTWKEMSDRVSSEQSGLGECNRMEPDANNDAALIAMKFGVVDAGIVKVGKVSDTVGFSPQHTVLLKYPVKLEAENTENNSMGSLETCLIGSSNANVQENAISTEIHEVFLDDLDHIVLKERRRLLLSRKVLGFIKPAMEGNISGLSSTAYFAIHRSAGIGKESMFGGKEPVMGGSHLHDIPDENVSGLFKASHIATPECPALTRHCQGSTSIESGISASMHKNSRLCSSCKIPTSDESNSGNNLLSGNQNKSALPTFSNVKAEPLDTNELQIPSKEALDNSFDKVLPVKNEVGIIDETLGDRIDHMLLRERMILLASRGPDIYGTSRCSRKIIPSLDYSHAESTKPLRMKHPRKRRKTATDSVETALEEDAPGLLQVLVEKGVLLDEIKLYDEMEGDEVVDDSLTEDSFTELEAVISKLFSQRPSLLKLAPIRCTKGERASYCLACLISLVEQARYLQFRKWPVEWGWCRDLQSFIFVFERHNRIVLERPEYGYATYFFELVGSLPIRWQIKRLVTAMKLTSCSRVTLIENRALTVGDDLTEGEARVLMEYGWEPDSGLGTMLNYCDRVVHDRKNESDSSEWRSKIGKLLVDGYNGGTIVSTDIPKTVMEHGVVHSPQIKLEL